jgi:hypothetical protein
MESINFLILDDLDYSKVSDSFILMTDSMYNNILNSINFNYLLMIFTIGCLSSILCSIRNENKYKLIQNANPVNAEIVELKGTNINKVEV